MDKINPAFIKALSYYGISEVQGHQESNPIILAMIRKWLKNAPPDDDDTSWCKIFWNEMAEATGMNFSPSLAARSGLRDGILVPENKVQLGDGVVFWRGSPKSWQGHIGWVVRIDEKYVWTLGGNQENQVKITPYSKNKVLGFIRQQKKIACPE